MAYANNADIDQTVSQEKFDQSLHCYSTKYFAKQTYTRQNLGKKKKVWKKKFRTFITDSVSSKDSILIRPAGQTF